MLKLKEISCSRKPQLNTKQRRNERRLFKLCEGLPEIEIMEILYNQDQRKINLKVIKERRN